MNHDTEPTIQDLLIAMNQFSAHVDTELFEMKYELSGVKNELSGMRGSLSQMVSKDYLHDELGKMKVTMVTKDYLDDKLSDLCGEFFLNQKNRHVPSFPLS